LGANTDRPEGDVNSKRVVIVGGGAAGFFAAIACAEEDPGLGIVVLEKTSQFLSKVKISGGGRCNVTHALFNEREFATRFPRGERALIAPFKRFQASDTVEWFAQHGVKLKTESDGRMFPTTDSSQTIIDCLIGAARKAGVKMKTNCAVERVEKNSDGKFQLTLSNDGRADLLVGQDAQQRVPTKLSCDRVLLATGGCRTPALGQLAVSLGHTLEPPVPSLFTFHIETLWLRGLAGVSVETAEVFISETKLRERGPLLITHWGLSGPVILRLSAWGARTLHEKNYRFGLHVNWLPHLREEEISKEFQARRGSQGAKLIVNSPINSLPTRLWEQLVLAAGVSREMRWSAFPRPLQNKLIQQLLRSEFLVTGKSLNKDEFVTCGGVRLSEVNFKKMESKICPGLFFAGELLDIDGITGGFNFQAAWTTGWIAGKAMAESM
jgi:predicted Rossmann fold flavoprotein